MESISRSVTAHLRFPSDDVAANFIGEVASDFAETLKTFKKYRPEEDYAVMNFSHIGHFTKAMWKSIETKAPIFSIALYDDTEGIPNSRYYTFRISDGPIFYVPCSLLEKHFGAVTEIKLSIPGSTVSKRL